MQNEKYFITFVCRMMLCIHKKVETNYYSRIFVFQDLKVEWNLLVLFPLLNLNSPKDILYYQYNNANIGFIIGCIENQENILLVCKPDIYSSFIIFEFPYTCALHAQINYQVQHLPLLAVACLHDLTSCLEL